MNKTKAFGGVAALLIAGGFIATHEGKRNEAYADPIHGWRVPTVCYGQTGSQVRRGPTFTDAECLAMLDDEMRKKAAELDACIRVDVPDHAAAATLSLAYNVGTGAVCRSTLVRMINQGAPPEVYCPQIGRWVYAGGKDCRNPANNCRGIATRRIEEIQLCEGRHVSN